MVSIVPRSELMRSDLTITGTGCYLTFGDQTADLITLNLPPSENAVILMQLLYSVSLFFTYPLMMFPVTNNQQFFNRKINRKSIEMQTKYDSWHTRANNNEQ